MKVCVCPIVHSFCDELKVSKIDHLNGQLVKWASDTGVYSVKLDSLFRLGNGDIDETCFTDSKSEEKQFSRNGAVRLLNALARQLKGFSACVNWEQMKRNSEKTQFAPRPNFMMQFVSHSNSSTHMSNTWQQVSHPRGDVQGNKSELSRSPPPLPTYPD